MSSTALFDSTYDALIAKLNPSQIKPENIMIYVKYAMEIVEGTPLKGIAQKQLVIDVIRKLIVTAKLSTVNESLCMDFIDSGALSQTIDLIVDASKGKLNINKPIVLIKRILTCCLAFLNRRPEEPVTYKSPNAF